MIDVRSKEACPFYEIWIVPVNKVKVNAKSSKLDGLTPTPPSWPGQMREKANDSG